MAARIQKMTKVDGAGNVTYTWTMDIGLLYKKLILYVADGIAAPITDFTTLLLKINGTNFWPLNGQQIDEMNKRDGLPAFDGFNLLLHLGLAGMKDPRMVELTYVNTGVQSKASGKVISTFQLQVTLSAAHALEMYAEVDNATADGPGVVKRFGTYDKDSVAAPGFTGMSNFDYGTAQWAWWRRIFTKCTAGALSFQKLYTSRETIWGEQVPVPVANFMATVGGHVTGAYFSGVIDFTASGEGYPALATVDNKGVVAPSTADNPMLDTTPYNEKTITLQNWNTLSGSNAFLLEAVGEID